MELGGCASATLREAIRLKHYSIRTEKASDRLDQALHSLSRKRHPREMGAAEIEEFLTHLAVDKNVAASTQIRRLRASVTTFKAIVTPPAQPISKN